MATYRCLADLWDKELKSYDIVIFGDITYEVKKSFLNNHYDSNEQIFERLAISKTEIARQAYGYSALGGSWPECKDCDYSALTRLVIKLYEIFEEKTSTTSEKEQWYKITTPGKTGISPEQVKELITKYGGRVDSNYDYKSNIGIYYWKKGKLVDIKTQIDYLPKPIIEVSPTTEITTTKKEEKHETQFQRKKARIERGTRPEGSTVCGRRSKASIAIGHLGYRKVTGI